ncbi:hypothetical protein STCU_10968 [Strigomonas culicis]|uniref:Uncharacterized protein n=1 Tax=Strigomonas culicis TaxID=28005 RepID=S9V1Z2_9TRYP|nr:hypothetical protein STCU_10968 [Strigomonas culicis]|eukprot:EPY16840.1 hypothetical protein STCU_10968 [Strigomonas culicis]
MGGVPSRQAPDTYFSLLYGEHEVGLIPLTRAFFGRTQTDDAGTAKAKSSAPTAPLAEVKAADGGGSPRCGPRCWAEACAPSCPRRATRTYARSSLGFATM